MSDQRTQCEHCVLGACQKTKGWCDPSPTYADHVRSLVDMFTYELCAECGRDLDAHTIGPDMFGHPHAWCITTPEHDLNAIEHGEQGGA